MTEDNQGVSRAETLVRQSTPDFLSQRSPAVLCMAGQMVGVWQYCVIIEAHLNQTGQEPVGVPTRWCFPTGSGLDKHFVVRRNGSENVALHTQFQRSFAPPPAPFKLTWPSTQGRRHSLKRWQNHALLFCLPLSAHPRWGFDAGRNFLPCATEEYGPPSRMFLGQGNPSGGTVRWSVPCLGGSGAKRP